MRSLMVICGILFLAFSFFVAAMAANLLNLWMVLFVIEVVVVGSSWFLLSQGVPSEMVEVSKSNRYRIDGSKSRRRERRELNAALGFRFDVLAVLIMVVMSGNALVLVVDSYIIPLSMIADSLGLFSFDLASWRNEMADRNLDRDFSLWRGLGEMGNNEVQQQPHFVKTAFPIVIAAMIAWVVGCLWFVRYSYQVALQKYCIGIRSRCNEYLNLDIGRLQG